MQRAIFHIEAERLELGQCTMGMVQSVFCPPQVTTFRMEGNSSAVLNWCCLCLLSPGTDTGGGPAYFGLFSMRIHLPVPAISHLMETLDSPHPHLSGGGDFSLHLSVLSQF